MGSKCIDCFVCYTVVQDSLPVMTQTATQTALAMQLMSKGKKLANVKGNLQTIHRPAVSGHRVLCIGQIQVGVGSGTPSPARSVMPTF